MVKREFGPEAVILSAKTGSSGGGVLGVLRKPTAVVTAAVDSEAASIQPIEKKPEAPVSPPPVSRKKGKNMDEARRRHTPDAGSTSGLSTQLRLFENLLAQGVDKAVAEKVCGDMLEEGFAPGPDGRSRQQRMLAAAIDRLGIRFCRMVSAAEGPRVAAVIGPWGCGKTTVAAKMAARHCLDMGEKVALVSMDNQKIAGQEELTGYAGILDIPFRFVSDVKRLSSVIKEFKDFDLVLVDAPGFSLGPEEKGSRLSDVETLASYADLYLVLDSTMKDCDLMAAAQGPAAHKVKGVVFTKIDQTAGYGNILTFLVYSEIPAAYWSYGRRVPMDFSEASSDTLSSLLTGHGVDSGKLGDMKSENVNPGPVEAPARQETPPKSRNQGYVGNRSSGVFHRQDCVFVKRINGKNSLIFTRPADALAMGFSPCGICCPDMGREDDHLHQAPAEKHYRLMKG